jgi:hypothetical protein
MGKNIHNRATVKMNDNDQEISFLPFHAINEFMTDAYRQEVIRFTLSNYASLPEVLQGDIDRLTKSFVKVPGFRHSDRAPAGLKIQPMSDAFQKYPELVATILSAWSTLKSELRLQTYDLLISRGWELLPADADRTALPGFLTIWPTGETFEIIEQAFKAIYPAEQTNFNDIALITVWLSTRLPYQLSDTNKNLNGSEADRS